MSAWTVAQGHIDVLVNALFEYGVVDPSTNGRELGQELWHENHLSINHLYSESTPTPDYVLTTTEAPLMPDAIFEAVSCFVYQSCEHPEWKDSRSLKLMIGLKAAAEGRGGTSHGAREYPWGFTSLDQAIKSEVQR